MGELTLNKQSVEALRNTAKNLKDVHREMQLYAQELREVYYKCEDTLGEQGYKEEYFNIIRNNEAATEDIGVTLIQLATKAEQAADSIEAFIKQYPNMNN